MSVVPEPSTSARRIAALVELIRAVEPRRVVHRRPWRRSGRSRDSASSRPRRCGCARDRSGRRRTCRRGRSTASPSANTRRGPFSSSRGLATRRGGTEARLRPASGYQTNASSSVIRTSARPSPSRSTKRRFGSFQAMRLGARCERAERLPALRRSSRSKDTRTAGPSNCDEVELAVAGQVQRAAAPPRDQRRPARHARRAARAARSRAVAGRVALVEPGARLLGQDAGDALAVEVDPLVRRAVQRRRADAARLAGSTSRTSSCTTGLAVLELERRQRRALRYAAVVRIAHGSPPA